MRGIQLIAGRTCLAAALMTPAIIPSRLSAQQKPAEPQAQTTTPPAPTGAASSVPTLAVDARATREQLRQVLLLYPPDLGRILQMDPTMMQDQAYLGQYPALASFLATHPEVARNPTFYLEFVRQSIDYTEPYDARRQAIGIWRDLADGVSVLSVMVFVASVLSWLVKTVLDHRRWLRQSRVQTEVHHKLLDRFAGTGELLTYIQTPAGRRFLEATPIATMAVESSRTPGAPLSRILWSIQAGVILAIGGLGFQFASGRVVPEVAEGLSVIGILGIAFGIGFVLSGVASYVLSKRMGLLEPVPMPPTET